MPVAAQQLSRRRSRTNARQNLIFFLGQHLCSFSKAAPLGAVQRYRFNRSTIHPSLTAWNSLIGFPRTVNDEGRHYGTGKQS
jgi:hypothetical protein